MNLTHDPEADAASIQLSTNGEFSHNETLELPNGVVILDISKTGTVTGIEFVGVAALLEKDTIERASRIE